MPTLGQSVITNFELCVGQSTPGLIKARTKCVMPLLLTWSNYIKPYVAMYNDVSVFGQLLNLQSSIATDYFTDMSQ